MKLYSILLFLFIFGLVSAGLNESGMFEVSIPTNENDLEESNIQEIGEGVENTGINPLTGFMLIFTFFRIFFSAVMAIVTILPILSAWGVPLWAGMMVQGPIWIVEIAGFYQFVTGHQMQGME